MDGPGSVGPLRPPAPLLPLRDRLPLFGRVPVFFRSLGHREACGWGGALLVLPVSLRLPSSWPLPVSPSLSGSTFTGCCFTFPQGCQTVRHCSVRGAFACVHAPPTVPRKSFVLSFLHLQGQFVRGPGRPLPPRSRSVQVLLGASPPAQTFLSCRRLLTGANRDLTLLFRNLET